MRVDSMSIRDQLPANIDAEKMILGGILLDNRAMEEVKLILGPEDFSLNSNQLIVACMGFLSKKSRPIDIVTLCDELDKRKKLEDVGGRAYILSLTEGLPRRPNVAEYAGIVKEKSVSRRMILACEGTIAWLEEQTDPASFVASALIENVEKMITPAKDTADAEVQNFIVDVGNRMNEEYRTRTSPAVASGNAWFDHKMAGGYKQGKTTLVAARPKVGKTSWLITSVMFNLLRGVPVSIFSGEMDKDELSRNMFPYLANVSNFIANRPSQWNADQARMCNDALGQLAELPLRIYDGPQDIDHICWTIDRDADKHGVKLFGADHLTLIDGRGNGPREKVNDVSGKIRQKIKHKKAAFILLCQLTKVNREYADKPPLPSDIKESGNPGEDAHSVLMLHRPWDGDAGRPSTNAELNLAYVRGGGGTPGMTKAHFDTKRLEFQAEPEMDFDNRYE